MILKKLQKTLLPIILGSGIFGFASAGKAATIAIQADDDNGFSFSSGADLLKQSLVRVGYFTLTDAEIQANAFNISFLNQNFVEFGTARIGDTYDVNGHLERTINNPNSDTPNPQGISLTDKQVYLWVFASTDNSSADLSRTTAFEHGIFYMDKAVDTDWRIRGTNEVPNGSTIDISDLTDTSGANLIAGSHVVVGSFSANSGTSDLTGARNFALSPVPEPGSALLAGVGGIAMLLRRRRRA